MILPCLPTAVELAQLAARLPVPALLWTLAHDLTIPASAGQLAPIPALEPGEHLMDRPIPRESKRTILHHALRALLGTRQTYRVQVHGRRWQTVMEPIPHPFKTARGRTVLGVLATSVLVDVPVVEPDPDFLGAYTATRSEGEIRVGDHVTVRTTGVMHHRPLAARRFDELLGLGVLTPDGPCVGAPGPGSAGGRGRRPVLRLA